MTNKKIVMLGGIGTAVNIAEQIQHARDNFNFKDEFLGFAFDDESFGNEINGFPILGKTRSIWDKLGAYSDIYFMYQLYRPDKIKERSHGFQSLRFLWKGFIILFILQR